MTQSVPLASVQLEGTQLEISLPDRLRKTGSSALKNGGKGMAKTIRTPGDCKEISGNFNMNHAEENIPLTTPKNSCHNSNHNNPSPAYASLHHEPSSVDGDLI